MSIKMMSLVWEYGPSEAADTLMLLAIADHFNDSTGDAWPSVRTLASKCRVTERTVQRTLRRLEEEGWLSITTGGGLRRGFGMVGIPNRYRFNLSKFSPSEKGDVNVGVNPEKGDAHDEKGDVGDTRRVTPTSGEPLVEPLEEPKTGGTTTEDETGTARLHVNDNQRDEPDPFPSRPSSIPRGWTPGPKTRARFEERFGKYIDVDSALDQFVAHYVEHSEVKSSDWTARAAKWLARDVSDVKNARVAQANGPDELGMMPWQHAQNGPETREERAARIDRQREREAELTRRWEEEHGQKWGEQWS